MPEGVHCFTVVQTFFVITTVIFILLTFVFMNRYKHLRIKISKMIETTAKLTKELEDTKKNAKNPLDPFIPETSRSIIISIDLIFRFLLFPHMVHTALQCPKIQAFSLFRNYYIRRK